MSVVSVAILDEPSAVNSPAPLSGRPSSALPAVAASRPYRILVTGSRDWADPFTIWDALDAKAALIIPAGYRMLTIVHGDCPTGADSIAQDWTMFPHVFESVPPLLTVLNEPHPADWAKWHNAAGPKRNKLMVELGADVCLAFIKNHSRGATGCLELALAAGIPTEVKRA